MGIKLTVWFDDPFWVGVFERTGDGVLRVCRHVFGSEPKDEEVYAFVLGNYTNLRFGGAVEAGDEACRRINPKRLQWEISRQTAALGVGTKAQQALQADLESRKLVRKALDREAREALQERRFMERRQKRKEKHRGH